MPAGRNIANFLYEYAMLFRESSLMIVLQFMLSPRKPIMCLTILFSFVEVYRASKSTQPTLWPGTNDSIFNPWAFTFFWYTDGCKKTSKSGQNYVGLWASDCADVYVDCCKK